jgi:SAM-dependent methyltransferase
MMMCDLKQPDTWDGAKGDLWVRRQRENDAFLEPFGTAALSAAGVMPDEIVIDVGCGCGATTLALARAVGPTGRVVAIDISAAMLAVARERIARAGFEERVTFVCADATVHPFEAGAADVLYSRFGVMFFNDPVAAFRNFRRAMKPDGRLAFVCWQSDRDNAWKSVPYDAALTVLPAPLPRDPEAPGGSSFASVERVNRILDAAGWRRVALAPYRCDVRLGATIEAAAEEASETSLFGDLIATARGSLKARAMDAVREALSPYVGPGGVMLGAATWIVTASCGEDVVSAPSQRPSSARASAASHH